MFGAGLDHWSKHALRLWGSPSRDRLIGRGLKGLPLKNLLSRKNTKWRLCCFPFRCQLTGSGP